MAISENGLYPIYGHFKRRFSISPFILVGGFPYHFEATPYPVDPTRVTQNHSPTPRDAKFGALSTCETWRSRFQGASPMDLLHMEVVLKYHRVDW